MNGLAALDLLCGCLRDLPPAQAEALRRRVAAPGVDWRHISMLASHHLVSPALYGCLRRAGLLDAIPADFTTALAKLAELNRTRNLAILRQLSEIAAILNVAGITPAPLKGAATLLCDARATDERIVGDLDLLVPETRVEDAKAALLASGYRRDRRIGLKLRLHFRAMHDTEPLLPPQGITHVELHRRALYSVRASRVVDDVAAWAVRRLDGGGEVRLPGAAGRFLHNALHHQIQRHSPNWRRGTVELRQAHEGYRIAMQGAIDWPRLAQAAERAGFGEAVAAYLECVNRLFGAALPLPARRAAAARRWVRRIERRYASRRYDRWDRALHAVVGFPAYAAYRVAHWLRMLRAAVR